jgi:hypothetical protein
VITEIGDLARIDKSRSAELTMPISVAAQASPGVADAAHP